MLFIMTEDKLGRACEYVRKLLELEVFIYSVLKVCVI